MSVIIAELNNNDIPAKTFVRQMTFAKAREKYGDQLHPTRDCDKVLKLIG